jgi:hypothetical protein
MTELPCQSTCSVISLLDPTNLERGRLPSQVKVCLCCLTHGRLNQSMRNTTMLAATQETFCYLQVRRSQPGQRYFGWLESQTQHCCKACLRMGSDASMLVSIAVLVSVSPRSASPTEAMVSSSATRANTCASSSSMAVSMAAAV